MNDLEKKIDKLINTVEGLDKKFDNFVEFSSERLTEIEDKMATKEDLQKLKLEAVDKYIKVDKFDNHETRIQALESKTV